MSVNWVFYLLLFPANSISQAIFGWDLYSVNPDVKWSNKNDVDVG